MGSFRILAMPTSVLQRLRRSGVDDYGNVLSVSTARGGAPLRCCLREAVAGERIALVGYQPARIGGPYAEVGPVFIHARLVLASIEHLFDT